VQVAEHQARTASNQQKRDEVEERLEGARNRNADLERRLAEIRSEREHWDRKGEAAATHLREVQVLLEKRKAHQEAAEAMRADRIKVEEAKAKLEADLAALRNELDQQNRTLAAEQDKADTIHKQAAAAEALYAEQCSTALKEELAEMIQHVHDTELVAKELREGTDPLEANLAATKRLVEKCQASTMAALDELTGHKERVQEVRSALDKRRAAAARLHALRTDEAALEEEVAALQQRSLDDKNRAGAARQEKRFQLRMYREAVKLLKDTAIKEEQALAAVPPSADAPEPADPPVGGDRKDSQNSQPPLRLRMW
jgi:chromosome segregation ATPase